MPWRRFVTVPGYALAWIIWLLALPITVPVAALADVIQGTPWVALRCVIFLAAYLSFEMIAMGVETAFWIWKQIARLDDEAYVDLHYALEAWWGGNLLGSVIRVFGMEVSIEGEADSELGRGPYLLLLRHVSMADTLLAAMLISGPHGQHLRYVLKNELLMDPALDIGCNRLPWVFIDREADDAAAELAKIQSLAVGLGPKDGLLIYPEGTRFTEKKREQVIDGIRRKGDDAVLAYAESLQSVLPPRPRGTVGLLEAAPEVDIVICTHTGFEGSMSLTEIWGGALVGRKLQIEFRRIPRSAIPDDPDGQSRWLLEEWRQVDRWVREHLEAEAREVQARG